MIDPRQLFQILAQEGVEAVLVGGVAMIVQGVTHFTNDIDLCYRRDRDNLERLVHAFAPLHPRLRVAGLNDEQARALPFRFDVATLRNTESLTLTIDLGDIDLLGRISGIGDYDQLQEYVVEIVIGGTRIPVLNLEGIIANKRASARTKDLVALPHIEAALRLSEAEAESRIGPDDEAPPSQVVEDNKGGDTP